MLSCIFQYFCKFFNKKCFRGFFFFPKIFENKNKEILSIDICGNYEPISTKIFRNCFLYMWGIVSKLNNCINILPLLGDTPPLQFNIDKISLAIISGFPQSFLATSLL